MAAFGYIDQFSDDLAEGVHSFATHTFRIYLSNEAPVRATDSVRGDITEIANGNGYTTNGVQIVVASSVESSGTYTLTFTTPADPTWTASGGAIAQFRYVVCYNSSASDALVCYWDYGSAIDLATGETFTVAVTTGFTITPAA